MKEESFGDILFNAGVEVMAVDWDMGDTHQEIYDKAKELKETYNPDYIMGYCYGAFPAMHCCGDKPVFLLDPCAKNSFPENSKIVDMEVFMPKYRYDTDTKNTTIGTPPLPIQLDKIKQRINIFVTVENQNSEQENERGARYRFLKNKNVQLIPDSTHWIMIEPARYTLANKILEIMNA